MSDLIFFPSTTRQRDLACEVEDDREWAFSGIDVIIGISYRKLNVRAWWARPIKKDTDQLAHCHRQLKSHAVYYKGPCYHF